jgi:hypothetical protein
MTPLHEQAQWHGIEALKQYASLEINLIPCVPTDGTRERYRPIFAKEKWARVATHDIKDIRAYMNGGKWWTGRDYTTGKDLYSPITLFRFIPKDYGLVVIDIDRGHSNGEDGVENFYKWLEEVGIYRPDLPSFLQDIKTYPCYVSTPSGGLHVYFTVKENNTRNILDRLYSTKRLEKNIAGKEKGVEVFYSEPITAAGSAKYNGEYVLFGNISAAKEYPLILLRRTQRTEKTKTKSVNAHTSIHKTAYMKQNEIDLNKYRTRITEYLRAKGIEINRSGFISCLCHPDGKNPNMKVYDDHVYCFSCCKRLDIFGAAAAITGLDTKKDFRRIIDEIQRTIGG